MILFMLMIHSKSAVRKKGLLDSKPCVVISINLDPYGNIDLFAP